MIQNGRSVKQHKDAEKAEQDALHNIVNAIAIDEALPNQVFKGQWNSFLFSQSDWIFTGDFVGVIKAFFDTEGSNGASLVNLSRTISFASEAVAHFNFSTTTEGQDFEHFLRGNGPAGGWLYAMERYACASDIGTWCIYCEKENDIAVVALRDADAIARLGGPLGLLAAVPLDIACGTEGVFPFTQLTIEWRGKLAKHYG